MEKCFSLLPWLLIRHTYGHPSWIKPSAPWESARYTHVSRPIAGHNACVDRICDGNEPHMTSGEDHGQCYRHDGGRPAASNLPMPHYCWCEMNTRHQSFRLDPGRRHSSSPRLPADPPCPGLHRASSPYPSTPCHSPGA